MLYIHKVNSIDDFEEFYLLKCQKDAIAWSGFDNAPDKEKLRRYFIDRVLNNPCTHVYFLRDTESPEELCMGYEQFDLTPNAIVEMRGTIIKKKYQGLGYYEDLRRLIEEKIIELNATRIESWCSEQNAASMAGSDELGWYRTDVFKMVSLPLLGGEHKFYKWIKEL